MHFISPASGQLILRLASSIISKSQWCRGSTGASGASDPGSIPGWDDLFCRVAIISLTTLIIAAMVEAIRAESWALYELDTNSFVRGRHIDTKRQIASLTKMFTLAVCLQLEKKLQLDRKMLLRIQ